MSIMLEDSFEVKELDPEGKKFDLGIWIKCWVDMNPRGWLAFSHLYQIPAYVVAVLLQQRVGFDAPRSLRAMFAILESR